MRQNIIITLTAIMMITSCNKSKVTNSLSEMGLTEKVKSFDETFFDASEKLGVIEKGKEGITKYFVFNEFGNKIEESQYWQKELREKIIYFYNEQNNLKEERKVFGHSTASLDDKVREINEVLNYEYKLCKNGKILYRVVKPGSYEATRFGLIGDSAVYVYNGDDKLLEIHHYTSNQHYYRSNGTVSVSDVSVEKYNKEGQLEKRFSGTEIYSEANDEEKSIKNERSEKNALIILGFEQPKLGDLIQFDTTYNSPKCSKHLRNTG